MAELVLGPLLRYVDEAQATVWVEADAPCEVEVLGRRQPTFCICGHHYALVFLEDLEPGSQTPYEVRLDGELRWPEPGSDLPPSVIRTIDPEREIRIAFGSCRVSVPHEPPYTLKKDEHELGREPDALRTYAQRMLGQPLEQWPQLLFMLGDQVYADEDAPETREFIRSRRDTSRPPGEEVADFEEYTHLYRECWSDPVVRWLLSTVGSAMIFDDHDVHDDWNISISWLEEMREQPWWEERMVGALVSYWAYQHIGNLSPKMLRERGVIANAYEQEDAWTHLRDWARDSDWGSDGRRWSYSRTLGRNRFVFLDSREGRCLGTQPRRMFDDEEWEWLNERISGDVEHLIIADTLPVLMPPAMHELEAWNEAVCAGAWGEWAASLGERIRRAIDLEHWGAFQHSFRQLMGLIEDVGAGRRGSPPKSIVTLAGDIHHAYLAEVGFRRDAGVSSPVWQAVCSPYRNPLDANERRIARFGCSRFARRIARALAASAGVPEPPVRWRLAEPPTFDNQIATLRLDGPRASVEIERTCPGESPPALETSLRRQLA
ncbi:MAG: alkaline phosphatase family protein [Actinomycetota bacterium]|nr:alkaline phosphatase family protein [Actinomycetota bacterium]